MRVERQAAPLPSRIETSANLDRWRRERDEGDASLRRLTDERTRMLTSPSVDVIGRKDAEIAAARVRAERATAVIEAAEQRAAEKEAAADVVLAMLAERNAAGAVSNTRMALRKLRGGRIGMQTPYALDVVEIGQDGYGEPITTCIVRWNVDREPKPDAATRKGWPKSLRDSWQVLLDSLGKNGIRAWPYGTEGAELRAERPASVRTRFVDFYPSEGEDEAKRANAKRKAFARAVASATSHDLIGPVELHGLDHIWMKPGED